LKTLFKTGMLATSPGLLLGGDTIKIGFTTKLPVKVHTPVAAATPYATANPEVEIVYGQDTPGADIEGQVAQRLAPVKVKVVGKGATNCAQETDQSVAKDLLTANPGLTAIHAACRPAAVGATQAM